MNRADRTVDNAKPDQDENVRRCRRESDRVLRLRLLRCAKNIPFHLASGDETFAWHSCPHSLPKRGRWSALSVPRGGSASRFAQLSQHRSDTGASSLFPWSIFT